MTSYLSKIINNTLGIQPKGTIRSSIHAIPYLTGNNQTDPFVGAGDLPEESSNVSTETPIENEIKDSPVTGKHEKINSNLQVNYQKVKPTEESLINEKLINTGEYKIRSIKREEKRNVFEKSSGVLKKNEEETPSDLTVVTNTKNASSSDKSEPLRTGTRKQVTTTMLPAESIEGKHPENETISSGLQVTEVKEKTDRKKTVTTSEVSVKNNQEMKKKAMPLITTETDIEEKKEKIEKKTNNVRKKIEDTSYELIPANERIFLKPQVQQHVFHMSKQTPATKLVIGKLTVEVIEPLKEKKPPLPVHDRPVFQNNVRPPQPGKGTGLKIRFGLGQL